MVRNHPREKGGRMTLSQITKYTEWFGLLVFSTTDRASQPGPFENHMPHLVASSCWVETMEEKTK
jgi:hypothetical protein